MAPGTNLWSKVSLGRLKALDIDEIDEELGFVHCTRGMGRKRVLVSNCMEDFTLSSPFRTPFKKRSNSRTKSEKSHLEALPQDILVQILCGVDHDDLKQLFQVSKSIRDATLIAKQWHFAFNTPSSKTTGFGNFTNFEDAPNAPKHERIFRSRIDKKKLSDITVALFASPGEERWPRDGSLMETET